MYRVVNHAISSPQGTVNYSKKPGFFKEQNAGCSAQIYRVPLIKTWFTKKAYYLKKRGIKVCFVLLSLILNDQDLIEGVHF